MAHINVNIEDFDLNNMTDEVYNVQFASFSQVRNYVVANFGHRVHDTLEFGQEAMLYNKPGERYYTLNWSGDDRLIFVRKETIT